MTILLCFKRGFSLKKLMKVKTLYTFKMTAKVKSIKVCVALKLSAVYVFNRGVRFCIVKKNDLCFRWGGDLCSNIVQQLSYSNYFK